MLIAIGMSLLQIYLWGVGIIIGLFLFFGGLVFFAVRTTGKKPEKKDGTKKPSVFIELLGLLRMASFFGFLWPYMIVYAIYTLLKGMVLKT